MNLDLIGAFTFKLQLRTWCAILELALEMQKMRRTADSDRPRDSWTIVRTAAVSTILSEAEQPATTATTGNRPYDRYGMSLRAGDEGQRIQRLPSFLADNRIQNISNDSMFGSYGANR